MIPENYQSQIEYFLQEQFLSYTECLDFYVKYICNNLMYTDPTTIIYIQDKIKTGIIDYAKTYSKVYQNFNHNNFYTREQLNNKEDWICKNIPSDRILNQNTSGSTTGEPFEYYNDKKYFDTIQRLAEFDTILKEYDLFNKPLKILNLFKHPYNPKPENFFLEIKNHNKRKFHSYGAENTTTYFINWDEYIENSDGWHEQLLNLLSNNHFDILLSSGPVINILVRHIKKNNFTQNFAYLLSHTTEFPRISDFEFLKTNNNISNYCDHMRCWDGGASFFTCKHETYHLNDHLSWVVEGPNNKMISTDYFNIVSPFINYWNGDLCQIENEYKLCDCGRYYRPFKMLENRPFALKGPTKLTEIKKQIGVLEYKNKIDQIQFENLDVNVYLNTSLTTEEISFLQYILQAYKVNFYDI